jgi:hypothetical protein
LKAIACGLRNFALIGDQAFGCDEAVEIGLVCLAPNIVQKVEEAIAIVGGWAQPSDDRARILVYVPHHADLVGFLTVVLLIYADRICPDSEVGFVQAKLPQRRF